MKYHRRYDATVGIKERRELIHLEQFQAHCNEFFRKRGMPINQEFKSRKDEPHRKSQPS